MNHHVRTAAILQRGALMPARARIGQVARRRYATEPASPSPPPRQPSKSGTFYKSFGTPILKCFLGALFTYQVAYWAWLKLESIESKHDKDTEIHDLKQELKAAVLARKQEASEKVAGVKDAGGMEGKVEQEQEKKKGWLGW